MKDVFNFEYTVFLDSILCNDIEASAITMVSFCLSKPNSLVILERDERNYMLGNAVIHLINELSPMLGK